MFSQIRVSISSQPTDVVLRRYKPSEKYFSMFSNMKKNEEMYTSSMFAEKYGMAN